MLDDRNGKESNVEHIGELIRHIRGRLGMTQEDLAERAGLSPTTVVRLENGEIKRPRTNTLSKLSIALGLGPHELSHFMRRLGNFEPVEVGGVGPFTAVFQRDGDWWIGYVEELPGANAQG